MKLLRSLFSCAFVLSCVPSLAWGDEQSVVERARHRVESALVKPLAQQETPRFSRARPIPRERRVRVLDAAATTDANKRAFLRFAIDVRFGSEWRQNDVVGCVYTGSGDLYVKSGDAYRPGAFLLGKNVAPVAGVCEAPPAPARA